MILMMAGLGHRCNVNVSSDIEIGNANKKGIIFGKTDKYLKLKKKRIIQINNILINNSR